MKRIKTLFLILPLLAFIPVWRYLDFIHWIWASPMFYSFLFFLTGLLCISLPLLTFHLKKASLITLSVIMLMSGIYYSGDPFSKNETSTPDTNHCGFLTYTATFYPLINWVTPSHADDLEIRNQLCWIRKIINETPSKIDSSSDLSMQLNHVEQKLLNTDNKYRASLPLIGLLNLIVLSKYSDFSQNTSETNGKIFFETLKFWQDQYTYEIHSKSYPWWDIPHGPYIKWEYGLIERNWDVIIDFIKSADQV
jgi:hypothetical protein